MLQKNVKTHLVEVKIDVSRDRNREYEPHIISKYSRNADGMDEKILSLYAAGITDPIGTHTMRILAITLTKQA